jgi:formimidoylglutamate deiminase
VSRNRTRAFIPEMLLWEGEVQRGLALLVTPAGEIAGVASAVGPEANAADVERVPLPGQALLPGLVNGHSHGFQRLIRGRTEYLGAGRERDDFWSWREPMYACALTLTPEEVHVASRQAFVEMALAGITAVGEFHYLHHQPDGTPYPDRLELSRQVVRAAREVGLRIVLLRVGYARSGFEVPENPRQRRFFDPDVEDFLGDVAALRSAFGKDPGVTVGCAPHSVRAVPRAWLERVAASGERLVHMHVAEQPAEVEACLREHRLRPVAYLRELGLLRPELTAVHGVHLEDEEIRALGEVGATVCACPSTERNLGDGIVQADALYAAGVNLCFGSDSQTQLDLLGEARMLESHLRLLRLRRAVLDPGGGREDGLGARLLFAASRGGARSLGLPTGELRPGVPADFFTVQLAHPSLVGADAARLLPQVVFGASSAAVREVVVDGERVVRGGHHPLAEESGRAFSRLSRRIFG